MSEEFIFEASFKVDSIETASKLEEVIECIELHDIEEARDALPLSLLLKAEQRMEELTSAKSEYKNGTCLISMAADTYDSCVTEMQISFDEASLSGVITIEGHDHEADDLCASMVLLLIAVGASRITAHGSSPDWSGHWFSTTSGELQFDFNCEPA